GCAGVIMSCSSSIAMNSLRRRDTVDKWLSRVTIDDMGSFKKRMIGIISSQAAVLVVISQGLDSRSLRCSRQSSWAKLVGAIKSFGVVQIDVINTIGRSHELVLLSRIGSYDPALVLKLLQLEPSLVEQWAHVASLVPVEDYPLLEALARERRKSPNKKL